MSIDRKKFRQLVEEHLLPLFSGATLASGFRASTPRQAQVSYCDPCSFTIKPYKQSDYCVALTRSQPFAVSNAPFVTEYRVTRAFVDVLSEIEEGIGTAFEQDLLYRFTRRVVARSICNDRAQEPIILATIDQLDTWSTRLYEGQPISAAVGFVTGTTQGTVALAETWRDDYSAVLTNGFDTLLVSDYAGWVQGYEALTLPESWPPYAPHRLAPIAEWTGDDKMVLALNRTGEILVIRNKQLTFAQRGGRWHFLTHEPVITQMKCPQDHDVRKAVYASCLDASFARTGACVGIMTSGDEWCLKKIAPKIEDHIQAQRSAKAKLIHQIVGTRKFQQLDRRMRQELLAIDGATIIDHRGVVLAVGAILQIGGGSSGGGRLAAAIALSKYGTGIKVSQDGGIKGYYRCSSQGEAKPAFFVM